MVGPGMTADVNLIGDKRSVIAYMFTPFTRLGSRRSGNRPGSPHRKCGMPAHDSFKQSVLAHAAGKSLPRGSTHWTCARICASSQTTPSENTI